LDARAPIRTFDRFQRRHAPLAIVIAVLRNFSDQNAGNAAALIAYWAFFSIFPLLLLFTAVLGFVLAGHPGAQHAVLNSALRQFPIIGANLSGLGGSGIGLGVGIVGTLSAGLGVTSAVTNAFNFVYAIPHRDQPNFLLERWRGLKLLVGVGLLQVASTVAAGAVSGGFGGVLVTIAGIVLSLVLNLCMFFVVFRFLIPNVVPTRELWPGIVVASLSWEVLQSVGGIYVAHVVKGASQTYGTFATVIGLLTWLYLGARIVVYAAEINVVLTRRLWPRSLMAPPEPADRRARAALAKMEERDNTETVDVSFHPPSRRPSGDLGNPVYAVAPEPAPGERASSGRPPPPGSQASVDSLTVAQLLDAARARLDEDEPEAIHVREAIDQAREAMREA
jgi:YihY family inner membrane protein